ncbi:MAG: DUF309 domain-containing protein [wastewater metagenome]|nr:DUF309 domain-containing protein [Candidatus Loosdrechtia aerotolerans]
MKKYIPEQPQPFDPSFPRYCPQRPFPPYRHIPGITPHPFCNPRGHSYGLQEANSDTQVVLPEGWRESENYLYGIDLYNFAYWWEAGEAWEGLWKKAEGNCRIFLQGLIQISISLLKHHLRKLEGLRHLSTTGRNKLRQAARGVYNPEGIYMGIRLDEFFACLDEFFSCFFSHTVTEQTYHQITVKPLIYLHF